MKKKIIATLTAVSILATMMCSNVLAKDITGDGNIPTTVEVIGTVTPIIITVTVPTTLSFAINPNNDVPVTSVPATFSNNSNVGISIDFLGFTAKSNNNTKVVKQDTHTDWSKLGTQKTKTNIAIGIVDGANTYWSPDEPVSLATAPVMHTIPLNAKTATPTSKTVGLNVKTGNAWDTATSLSYDLNIKIKLA